MKINIMGLEFDNVTMEQAVEAAKQMLAGDQTCYVVTPNAEIAYEALKDPNMRSLLNSADLMLPDGAGVILASKILGKPLKQKVAGVDFADRLMSLLNQSGQKIYFLGSKPGVGELAAEKIKIKYPNIHICGIADGYFHDEQSVIEKINSSGADVLLVCLGAPKQEQFMKIHQNELRVKLMAGLGGTLDSIAGTVKRAPKWMIKLNLEWLYRLMKEPKRFGRMMRLPKYVFFVIQERIRGKKKWEN